MQTYEKSACSTLRNLFLNLHWDELKDQNGVRYFKEPPSSNAYHDTNYNHISLERWISNGEYGYKSVVFRKEYDDYFKFGIVRNTYDRVVSMYFNRWLGIPDFNSLEDSDITKEEYMKKGIRGLCNPSGCMDMDGELTKPDGSKVHINAGSFLHFLGSLSLHVGDQYSDNKVGWDYDNHYRAQYIIPPKLYDSLGREFKYIHLNNLNDGLSELYRDVIKLEDGKLNLIEKLLNDKKESLKKKLYDFNPTSLSNYDFIEDELGLDILKNGIPQKELIMCKDAIEMIKQLFSHEIKYHNFNYDNLFKDKLDKY